MLTHNSKLEPKANFSEVEEEKEINTKKSVLFFLRYLLPQCGKLTPMLGYSFSFSDFTKELFVIKNPLKIVTP